MAEIEEVPITDAPENVPGEASGGDDVLTPEPKKRGRPKGSVNRPKAKPEPKPKAVAKSKPKARRPPTPEESEEETPPPRKRRAPRRASAESPDSVSPEPPTSRDIAAEVLHLLSNRHVETRAAKRDKYRSWFQQQ